MKSINKMKTLIARSAGTYTLLWAVPLLFLGVLQAEAVAHGQEAGSLLIYPYYDSHPDALTIITVTNTNSNAKLDPGTGLQEGTIDVMFKYISGVDCTPVDRIERLTPNDTLSLVASEHNFNPNETGFLYVYAIDTDSGLPVAFDYLIGMETIYDIEQQVSFSLNPLAFQVGSDGPGDDHQLSLDGLEYEMMPDELLIPRFHGQGDGTTFISPFSSHLILFNLTGGAYFTAQAKVLVFNDNEQAFSDMVVFDCWDLVPLLEVSLATRLGFLEGTNHDPDEVEIMGVSMESGWLRLDGDLAFNAYTHFKNPAIYAVQIEYSEVSGYAAATLPFEKGDQDNGLLWSTMSGGNDDLPGQAQ